jgi:hypothetical protein
MFSQVSRFPETWKPGNSEIYISVPVDTLYMKKILTSQKFVCMMVNKVVYEEGFETI